MVSAMRPPNSTGFPGACHDYAHNIFVHKTTARQPDTGLGSPTLHPGRSSPLPTRRHHLGQDPGSGSHLDLSADVPGSYTATRCWAWRYYDGENRDREAGEAITIRL